MEQKAACCSMHHPSTIDFYNGYRSVGENLRGTVHCSFRNQEMRMLLLKEKKKANNGTYRESDTQWKVT